MEETEQQRIPKVRFGFFSSFLLDAHNICGFQQVQRPPWPMMRNAEGDTDAYTYLETHQRLVTTLSHVSGIPIAWMPGSTLRKLGEMIKLDREDALAIAASMGLTRRPTIFSAQWATGVDGVVLVTLEDVVDQVSGRKAPVRRFRVFGQVEGIKEGLSDRLQALYGLLLVCWPTKPVLHLFEAIPIGPQGVGAVAVPGTDSTLGELVGGIGATQYLADYMSGAQSPVENNRKLGGSTLLDLDTVVLILRALPPFSSLFGQHHLRLFAINKLPLDIPLRLALFASTLPNEAIEIYLELDGPMPTTGDQPSGTTAMDTVPDLAGCSIEIDADSDSNQNLGHDLDHDLGPQPMNPESTCSEEENKPDRLLAGSDERGIEKEPTQKN